MKKQILMAAIVLGAAFTYTGCGQSENSIASANETVAQENISDDKEETDESIAISSVEDTAIEEADITKTSDTAEDESAQAEDEAESDDNLDEGEEDNSVTISMVGDVLLHMPVEESAKSKDGSYDFSAIFANMKEDISASDVAIVNQEVIIGGEEFGISGYPNFNAPYEVGDALVDAGFDVICHGTNHALDKGKKGIVNANAYWEEKHPDITVIGINGTPEEKDRVDIVELKGIKIALLNYTYGTNGIPLPADMPYAVDMLVEDKVAKDLKYAEENADFTVVCPHWGTEYRLDKDSYQEYWTNIFRKNGADLIIGTHPHVIEPVEMIEDENSGITNNHGGGDMLVYYSLGNFVSWTSSTGPGVTNRMVGGMAKVTIEKGEDGEVSIVDHSAKAVVCHLRSGEGGVTVYPLSEYTDEMGKENEIIAQDPDFSRELCIDLCNKVWGDSWE